MEENHVPYTTTIKKKKEEIPLWLDPFQIGFDPERWQHFWIMFTCPSLHDSALKLVFVDATVNCAHRQ